MNYQIMGISRPRLIVLDEWVNIAWARGNKRRYTQLGYVYTALGDTFLCKVSDLSHATRVDINVLCAVCGRARKARYRTIIKSRHSVCRDCVKVIDLSGHTFGKLHVLDIDRDKPKGKGAWWTCECECGAVVSVRSSDLIKSGTVSCGCHRLNLSSLRSRENHYRWDSNKTDEDRAIGRKYPEYIQWRNAVYKRDNYTCQVCGKQGGGFEAHHLYSYADYPEYQLNVDYGITMCKSEHKEFHRWMGGYMVPCTPDDFDAWMRQR